MTTKKFKIVVLGDVSVGINEISIREEACLVFICCTKSDLLSKGNQKVSVEQIKSRADICNAKIFITSSKTGEGIYEMFQSIASQLLLKDDYKAKINVDVAAGNSIRRNLQRNLVLMRRNALKIKFNSS
ncbi:ras-related protein Rab-24-like isoform X1 [Leptotrombidium deliense]|uniref:Ras-related protein Rab-24-like isoform X1 n=1 Tax=Leptotrombidium deliense TaxID=299467 RepID=A0A443QDA5_9ACAR|nr:ras-related protein Rab-24-like isoform X1 [Leptotrombidium deliense]